MKQLTIYYYHSPKPEKKGSTGESSQKQDMENFFAKHKHYNLPLPSN